MKKKIRMKKNMNKNKIIIKLSEVLAYNYFFVINDIKTFF